MTSGCEWISKVNLEVYSFHWAHKNSKLIPCFTFITCLYSLNDDFTVSKISCTLRRVKKVSLVGDTCTIGMNHLNGLSSSVLITELAV